MPTTYLLTSFYWDNLIHFGMGPKKGPDGKFAITLPTGDAKLPGIAAENPELQTFDAWLAKNKSRIPLE